MSEEHFVSTLEKIKLDPGDVLLLRLRETVPMSVIEGIQHAFVTTFPNLEEDNNSILILPPYVDVAVLDGEVVKKLIIAGPGQGGDGETTPE